MQINSNYSMNGVPCETRRKQDNIPQFSTECVTQENENINPYMAEADFDEKGYETLCKVYGKIPSKHLKAKDYNCPYFDNENNGWYQLIKDKVEKAKGENNG